MVADEHLLHGSLAHEPRELVLLLGEFGARLTEFCRELTTTPPVSSARHGVECKSYETGPVVEIWAEASLGSETAIVWWMDLVPGTGDATWSMTAEVSLNGRESLMTCEGEEGLSFADMLVKAREMFGKLLSFRELPGSGGRVSNAV